MQKPISMIHDELIEKIKDDIQQSGLPACVIVYILERFLNDMRIISGQQSEYDRAEYQKKLEAEKKQDTNRQNRKTGQRP